MLNKAAIRRAIKGLPCLLNHSRLFGRSTNEHGERVDSTCAVGYLLQMAGAERRTYYGHTRNTAPIQVGSGWGVRDAVASDDMENMRKMFGLDTVLIGAFIAANDSKLSQGHKAAHSRCLAFKDQLKALL